MQRRVEIRFKEHERKFENGEETPEGTMYWMGQLINALTMTNSVSPEGILTVMARMAQVIKDISEVAHKGIKSQQQMTRMPRCWRKR